MDERTLMLIAGALVLGFVIGRLSARRGDGGYVGQPPGARSTPAPAPSATLDDAAADDILDLLRKGNKIEAIKRYRELAGADLKGAKDAIDALERRR